MPRFMSCILVMLASPSAWADPPVASYIFPAGGQRGATVKVRVGGLNLYKSCGAEMLGPGVQISPKLTRTNTLWFEGPILALPDSQRQEDYPKDMAGEVKIAADAPMGLRYWRLWTSQGATPGMKFVVGDLPEIVEEEIDGEPIPVPVKLPVTINGRIFPRSDIDVYAVTLKKGQTLTCAVNAAGLGSPLEAHLVLTDIHGGRIIESDFKTPDPVLRYAAPADMTCHVRIHDINEGGSQSHVYRLTLTTGPYLDHVFPLGGKRGSKVTLEVTGPGLPNEREVELPKVGDHLDVSLNINGQITNSRLLDVDDLDEIVGTGRKVELPCVCNGKLERPGKEHSWSFELKKGESMQAELRASRLGSPLVGVLTLVDVAGKEVAKSEDGLDGAEPRLRYTTQRDEIVSLTIRDRFKKEFAIRGPKNTFGIIGARSRGGPDFAYRLRLTKGEPAPDFRLSFKTDALTLVRAVVKPDPKVKGQPAPPTAKLPITLERIGKFEDAVTLTLDGLPKGVTVSNLQIPAKQNAVELVFKAEENTPIAVGRLTIRGTATIDKNSVTRVARLPAPFGTPEIDSVLLAVALPTPFKIKGEYDMRWASRGGWHERKYQLLRDGYDGPIEVSLADKQARHLQGVHAPSIMVPAGAKEFSYAVQLPPWMETGRTSRTCVMGVAVIKDKDGSQHEVSYSSVNTNDQLVAVVEPGKLGVDLDKTSLAVRPGQSASIPVRVARSPALKGDVTVELIVPGHLKGITADKLVIPAGKDEGIIQARFGDDLSPTINMPLMIRATLLDAGRPVLAETHIELVRRK